MWPSLVKIQYTELKLCGNDPVVRNWRVAGGHPHRFPHNNFSSVKNPIYFGVIRSKVKVTVTINIIFDNRVVSAR
jgi:hypothetical protein